jgi:hypothetical protein
MPKTITAGLETHIAQEVTTLASLWHVIRADGQEFFFTDHDADIVFEGDTYEASVGYNRTAVANQVGLSVDNLDVSGFLDSSALTDSDLRAGLYDHAEVSISLVNYADLTQGKLQLRRGRFGEVTYSDSGTFNTELRGLSQAYSQSIGEVYTATCRADLGDSRCKIPILPDVVLRSTVYVAGDFVRASGDLDGFNAAQVAAAIPGLITEDFDDRIYVCTTGGTTDTTQPTYDTTVGNPTTDGTAIFEAVEAWTRAAVVATVTDNRTFTITVTESRAVDNWFKFGAVIWDTGDNSELGKEIKAWVNSTTEVTLFLTMPFSIQIGDKLGIYAGCDKTLSTCIAKFDNVINFRGEPYLPGPDALLTIKSNSGKVVEGGKG